MHSWTYDGIGNRTSAAVNGTPTSHTYFTNPSNPLNGQRLQSDGVSAYTYDANGNTLTRTGTPGSFSFGWDAQDRLTSIAGSATASTTYDYQGRRTGKTTGGSTTSYLYDGLNLVRTSGASQAEYLFGPGIDEPLAMLRGGTVYHYSVDGLGSVALVTNQGGTTVHDAYLYDAWGALRRQTGTLANDFGYTAREFGEAGLWYYRARYYQPGIGRFGSEDALLTRARVLVGSAYSYVSNTPVQNRDPSGFTQEPSPMPPLCDRCCDPDKIRKAADRASTFRDKARKGVWPGGEGDAEVGGMVYSATWFDRERSRWEYRPVRPTLPNPSPDDCVRFCQWAHEWFHYFDGPPAGMTEKQGWAWWGDANGREGGAYDAQLRCLASSTGPCPKVDPFVNFMRFF